VVDSDNRDGAAGNRPRDTEITNAEITNTEITSTETTVHLTSEFAAQLAALGGDVSAEEKAAITALPSGSALLVVRRGPNTGARFLLDADVTTAGRHPDADILLDDVTVSRRHTEFLRQGRAFEIRDLGSLNGTYFDGVRIDTARLRDGAEVQVGKFRLTFYASRLDLAYQASK
jgi:pSer/pThr/pTyr-binding forkhead associated (FHA) protein